MTAATSEVDRRQRRVGTVVSNRSDKTIVVQIEALRRHPIYRKAVRIRRKLLAHDAENECEVGDVVEVIASRPYSRRKRWRLTQIVNRATLTEEEQAAIAIASEEAARAAEVVPIEEATPADDGDAVKEADATEETESGDDADACAAPEASADDDTEAASAEAPAEAEQATATDSDEDESATEPDEPKSDTESGQESDTATESS